jgi:hypothetical protein
VDKGGHLATLHFFHGYAKATFQRATAHGVATALFLVAHHKAQGKVLALGETVLLGKFGWHVECERDGIGGFTGYLSDCQVMKRFAH